MHKILSVLIILGFFASPLLALDLLRVDPLISVEDKTKSQCPGSIIKEDLFAYARSRNYQVYVLKATGSKKLVDFVNAERNKINAKKPDSEKIALLPGNAEFYYSPVDINATGIAFVADSCVIWDTLLRLDSNTVSELMAKAGVTANEMIPTPIDTKPVNNSPKTH